MAIIFAGGVLTASQAVAEQAGGGYAEQSDAVWALFKQRKYADADALLASLKEKNGGDLYQTDLETAKLLKEFWGRVEEWMVARKGKFVSIAGVAGNVTTVKDGVVTISRGGASFTRRIDQLTVKQALAYASLGNDKRSELLKGVFLLADGAQLAEAKAALAAAGSSAYDARLERAEESGVPVKPPTAAKYGKWASLFDGRTPKGWRKATEGDFSYEGEVLVKSGSLVLSKGTHVGVVWQGSMPTQNYEVELEAARVSGKETFCTVHFPIGKSRCMLVVGGWDGSVVALQEVDGKRADSNVTTKRVNFDPKRWYRVRLQVTSVRVRVWIGDRKVIDVPTAEHTFSVLPTSRTILPFGLSVYKTTGAFRNIRIRSMSP
jgi:hypothetical protein